MNLEQKLHPWYMEAVFGYKWDDRTHHYSQFTIDFGDNELNKENPSDDYMGALLYRVDNIIAVMSEEIPDCKFFRRLKAFLDAEYNKYSTSQKFVNATLKMMRG